MKAFKITVSVITLIAFAVVVGIALWTSYSPPPNPATEGETPPLRFSEDGTFTILHLTDFHEWMGIEKEGLFNIEIQDSLKPLLVEYVTKTLDEVKPDLVVLGGDNVFPLSMLADIGKNSVSLNTYRAIASLFEERSQYWTLTFGNHDSECVMNKDDFMLALSEYSFFIGGMNDGKWFSAAVFESDETVDGVAVDDYVGNFSIPVYDNSGTEILYNVFILDSGSFVKTAPAGASYRYITAEQTEWYLDQSEKLEQKTGGIVPAVMFTHIPLMEMKEAYELNGAADGDIYAGFSLSDTRSPIFKALFERGDVKGIFFGHEHLEDATVFYTEGDRSVMMGLTKMAQAQSYSDTTSVMNSRVITLSAVGGMSTYVSDSTGHTGKTVTLP